MARTLQVVRWALSPTKCRVGESDFGSSTNGRAIVDPRLADRHLQRARRSMGKMEGDEPTWIVPTISKPCLW